MSAGLVLLWLGTAAARVAHEPDLESWARSRWVILEDPELDRAGSPASHDDDAARRVEQLLTEARTDTYSAALDAANAALDEAERILLATPALPEAAWLMADLYRARAEAVNPEDTARKVELVRRADLLEGPLAETFGAVQAIRGAAAGRASSSFAQDRDTPGAPVPLLGPMTGDEIEIDGVLAEVPVRLSTGAHHVRVLRRGRLVAAAWVTAASDPVEIPITPPVPCGDADLGAVRETNAGPRMAGAVSCPHFAVAREAPRGIEVASCFGASCGPWLPWNRAWGESFAAPVHPPWPPARSNGWIFWTAAGIAAAGVSAVVLWREGVFEQHGPTRDSFVWVPPTRPR